MRKKALHVFIVVALLFVFSSSAYSSPGNPALGGIGSGVVQIGKGIGDGVTSLAKGTYHALEWIVLELFRPVRPITDKITDWFGVTEQENPSYP